jgi:hypothetical protein
MKDKISVEASSAIAESEAIMKEFFVIAIDKYCANYMTIVLALGSIIQGLEIMSGNTKDETLALLHEISEVNFVKIEEK